MRSNIEFVLLILLLLVFSNVVLAENVEIQTQATVRASIEKSTVDIRIRNIGTESVRNLSVEVYFNDQQKMRDELFELKPGDDLTASDITIADELLPGKYVFPIFLTYELENGEKRSSLAMNDLIIGPETVAGLTLTSSSIIIESGSQQAIPMATENLDPFSKNFTIQIYSPGLIENSDGIEVSIEAQSTKEVTIPIRAKVFEQETKAELIYVVSYTHQNAHYSALTKSPITVTPAKSLLTRIFSDQISILIAIGCLVLIIIVLSIRRR